MRRALFPFFLFRPLYGNRAAFSVPFLLFFSTSRAQSGFLYSLFAFFLRSTGTERSSLFPFCLFSPLHGNRVAFSVPFLPFSSASRAQSGFLYSLFALFLRFTGTERLSLFPFCLFSPLHGHRAASSVPFLPFFSAPRAQSGLLCSLFALFPTLQQGNYL